MYIRVVLDLIGTYKGDPSNPCSRARFTRTPFSPPLALTVRRMYQWPCTMYDYRRPPILVRYSYDACNVAQYGGQGKQPCNPYAFLYEYRLSILLVSLFSTPDSPCCIPFPTAYILGPLVIMFFVNPAFSALFGGDAIQGSPVQHLFAHRPKPRPRPYRTVLGGITAPEVPTHVLSVLMVPT